MDSQSTIGAKIRVELEAGNIEQTIDQINQAIDRISPVGEGAISDMMDMTGRGRGGMQGQMNRAAEVQRLYDSAMGAFSSDKMMSNGKFEEYNYQYQQWSALADKTSPESQKLKQKMSDALRSIYNDQMAEAKKIIEAGEKTLPAFGFSAEDSTEIGKIIRGDVRDKYVASRRVAESIGEKPEVEPEPQGMGKRMMGFIASSAAGLAGTAMTTYAHGETAWGSTAIEQYNARQSFEIQLTQTIATSIGTVIGGLIGAIGGPMTAIMGAGAGGMLGNGVANLLNIDDTNKQKMTNIMHGWASQYSKQFDDYDIQAKRLALRMTGNPGGLNVGSEDQSYYEDLGIGKTELLQLQSGFSAGYGYDKKRFDTQLSYAKTNGLDIKELSGLNTILRFGGNAGTGEIERMMKRYGDNGAPLTGDVVNFLVGQTHQAAMQGFRGNDITAERQGVLDQLYGSNDPLANPLGLASQSNQGFQSLTSNMGSPASIALLAQSYGLGTETDYAGFLKRVNQGFTKDNVQDVGKNLRNLYGGDKDAIYIALSNLAENGSFEWKERTAKAIASGKFDDLTALDAIKGDATGNNPSLGVAPGAVTRAKVENTGLEIGRNSAEKFRDLMLAEVNNTKSIVEGTSGAMEIYFSTMNKLLIQIKDKMLEIANENSGDLAVPDVVTQPGNGSATRAYLDKLPGRHHPVKKAK